jgi:hypothetical protein
MSTEDGRVARVECRVGKRVVRNFSLDTRPSPFRPHTDRASASEFLHYWTKVQYTALPLYARNSGMESVQKNQRH